MDTTIRLSGNQQFVAEFAARGAAAAGLLQFGWVYVVGEDGGATFELRDGQPPVIPVKDIPVPGMFSAVIRQGADSGLVGVIVKAGANGFRGSLHFELMPLNSP